MFFENNETQVNTTYRKALFLDRDGVINVDNGYVHRKEDFHFIEGIFDLCATAQRKGFLLIVITNQAGIGRGYYSENDFYDLTNWMKEEFNRKKIFIDDVFFCPFHPEFGLGIYKKDSYDRKPFPGMLLKAAKKFGIRMKDSIMIGDKKTDMEAAKAAGVGHRIQIVNKSPELNDDELFITFVESLNEVKLLNIF